MSANFPNYVSHNKHLLQPLFIKSVSRVCSQLSQKIFRYVFYAENEMKVKKSKFIFRKVSLSLPFPAKSSFSLFSIFAYSRHARRYFISSKQNLLSQFRKFESPFGELNCHEKNPAARIISNQRTHHNFPSESRQRICLTPFIFFPTPSRSCIWSAGGIWSFPGSSRLKK